MHTKKEAAFIFVIMAVLVFAVNYSVAQTTTAGNVSNATAVSATDYELVKVTLAKDKYVPNSSFEGSVKFYFDKPIDTSTLINARLFGKSKDLTIEQLLQNASKNYTKMAGILNGTDPAPVKVIPFPETGLNKIGITIPGYAQVKSVTMNVSGPPGNQIMIPRLDVGDDGDIDWYYLGELSGFHDIPTKPLGLDDTVPGTVVTINENVSILCQKIDLPFGRHFKIEVNYNKVGTKGDLWAMLLSPYTSNDFSYAMGEDNKCDLPEDTNSGYKECAQPIVLPYAAKGNNLVCVVNNGGHGEVTTAPEYELKSNSAVPSTTAFRCVKGLEGDFSCKQVTQNNFYIRVKGGKYSYFLDKMSDFDLFSLSPDAVLLAFRKFVGSNDDENPVRNFQGICREQKCLIPITVHVNGSGHVAFENLKVSYIFEEIQSMESNFVTVLENPPLITRIGVADLNSKPFELEVPLSIFGFKVPKIPLRTLESAKMILEFGVNGNFTESGRAEFTVYSKEVPPDESKKMIDEAKASLAELSSPADAEIALLIDLSGIRAAITAGQQQLANLEAKYASFGDSEELKAEVIAEIEKLPKGITLLSGSSEMQIVGPDELTPDIVDPDKADEAYRLQGKVSVKATVRTYSIEDYAGGSSTKSIIIKEITAKDALSRVNVFEVIPKSMANSLADIKFEQTMAPVKDDPIAKWFLSSLGRGAKQTYRYVVDGEVASTDSAKTVIVQAEPEVKEETVEEPAYECGNDVCEEGEDEAICPDDCKKGMPMTMIALMVVGILVVLFVAMKFLKKKKSPFARPEDLKAIMEVIKKMRASGKKDDEITKMLMTKGWKLEHAKFAMEQIALESKGGAKGASSKDPKLQPLKDYISVALSKGKKPEDIRKTLLSQGWDAKVIEQELAKK